jgi:hypothetical protein
MVWLAPRAFAALALLAGPVIVHLLTRRTARRVIFPATHFVRATQAASVALRLPSDIGLLLLRLAIVGVAVMAAARPLVMTQWRLAGWNARVSRAIVIDSSPSMSFDTARDALGGGIAGRLAAQEMQDAFEARAVTRTILTDGIERAVGWLRTVPPSRREIVVISDFQRGSLDADTLTAVPANVGIRFIRAGVPPETRRTVLPSIEGWRAGVWQATATIDAAGTRASWVRRGPAGAPRWISVDANAADADAADRALRAAVSPGVPAGDEGDRVLVRFAGAEPLRPPAHPIRSAWIARAALALSSDGDTGVGSPASISDRDTGVGSPTPIENGDPTPRVTPPPVVSERDGVMIVDAGVSAAALEAPAIVRAALLAVRPASIADTEAETVTLTDGDLARWRRDPAPVTSAAALIGGESAGALAAESDARWFWALALLLLGVEWRLRRTPLQASDREVRANAA